MQEINWGNNKELKSAYSLHRLQQMNNTCILLLQYASIAYGIIVLEAWVNGKSLKTGLYIYMLAVSLFIMKNLMIIGQKANKKKGEKSTGLSELNLDSQGYDNLTLASRALSVDFSMQFIHRFDDKRQAQAITDKQGIEAKSSQMANFGSMKTSNNFKDLISDAPRFGNSSMNQQDIQREESTDMLDDLLLGGGSSKSPSKPSRNVSPGNMQNSTIGTISDTRLNSQNSMRSGSSLIRRISTFSFSGVKEQLKEQLKEKKMRRLITLPLKTIMKLKKRKSKQDIVELQILKQDILGILNFISCMLILIHARENLIKSSHIILFPLSIFMIEMISRTIYSRYPQQICMVVASIMYYHQTETLIENISLFVQTLGSLYVGMQRLKNLEDEELASFEGQHQLQSSKTLIEQIFNTIPDGIGVIDFGGFSCQNKILTELIGQPSNFDSFSKNLNQFIRENQHSTTAFTLFEDLKSYYKNIVGNTRNIPISSESREYYTVKQSNSSQHKSKNSKIEPRKYYMIFMSKILYEGRACLLLTMRDVTNNKVIQEKKVVDEVKNRIFKSFTHELKNPLNFLLFSFELINKHINDLRTSPNAFKSLKQVVSTAESCTNVLRNIINDFIVMITLNQLYYPQDYSMLCSSNSTLILNKRDFDLGTFITHIERIIINQLKSPKVVFRVSRDPDLPKIIFSDQEKLEQILLNLLLNAMKFTQKGWIKFKIQKLVRKSSNIPGTGNATPKNNTPNSKESVSKGFNLTNNSNNTSIFNVQAAQEVPNSSNEETFIRFMVLDTGNGIEKERVQTIFNLFESNQSAGMSKEALENKKCNEFQNISLIVAAGLGLTISQNLCLALGGQIRCKSEAGQGSVFYFDIKYTLQKDEHQMNLNNQSTLLMIGDKAANLGRVISPNVYNFMEEDKIEENEALYMFKTQIGKFNTAFEQTEMDDLVMADEDLLQPSGSYSHKNSFNNQDRSNLVQNITNLQINTITEHMSENSFIISTQQNLNGPAEQHKLNESTHLFSQGSSSGGGIGLNKQSNKSRTELSNKNHSFPIAKSTNVFDSQGPHYKTNQRQLSSVTNTQSQYLDEQNLIKKKESLKNENNLKIKQILQNDNQFSFTGLKDLVSNPDQYELNFREEQNIVQLKWSKNLKQNLIGSTPDPAPNKSSVENNQSIKFFQTSQSQKNLMQNQEIRQSQIKDKSNLNNYHNKTQINQLLADEKDLIVQNFTNYENNILQTDQSMQQFSFKANDQNQKAAFQNSEHLEEEKIGDQPHNNQYDSLLEQQINKISSKSLTDKDKINSESKLKDQSRRFSTFKGNNKLISFEKVKSRESEIFSSIWDQKQQQENLINEMNAQPDTQRSLDSLDEHIKVDVIGDYARLLGNDKFQNQSNNYIAHHRSLVHSRLEPQLEPKTSYSIKNPFVLFDIQQIQRRELLTEEDKQESLSHRRNKSQIVAQQQNIASTQLRLTTTIQTSSRIQSSLIQGGDSVTDMRKLKLPIQNANGIQIERMLSYLPSMNQDSSRDSARQRLIDDYKNVNNNNNNNNNNNSMLNKSRNVSMSDTNNHIHALKKTVPPNNHNNFNSKNDIDQNQSLLSPNQLQKQQQNHNQKHGNFTGIEEASPSRNYNSMATDHNCEESHQILDNKGQQDQQSDLMKINDFLGDGSIYNHPMALDSSQLNHVVSNQEVRGNHKMDSRPKDTANTINSPLYLPMDSNQENALSLEANQLQQQNNNELSLLNLKNFCCPEILVVDDIDYNRFILTQVISTLFELDCLQACNGQECIDIVTEYDQKTCCEGLKLIIMDYEMPILNGLEASKRLCQRMGNGTLKKKIPIVALTAYNDEKEKCLSVGMKRFLTKPAKSEELKIIFTDILTGNM